MRRGRQVFPLSAGRRRKNATHRLDILVEGKNLRHGVYLRRDGGPCWYSYPIRKIPHSSGATGPYVDEFLHCGLICAPTWNIYYKIEIII